MIYRGLAGLPGFSRGTYTAGATWRTTLKKSRGVAAQWLRCTTVKFRLLKSVIDRSFPIPMNGYRFKFSMYTYSSYESNVRIHPLAGTSICNEFWWPKLPSFSPTSPLPPPLPLEVGPLNAARGLGSAVSSPSRVWGGATAEIEFCAF